MELFISLSFPIPLGLFIWIEVVVYRNYLKAIEQNPDKQIRSTVFWAFKTLLGALPAYLLIILIEILASTLISYPPKYWDAISYHTMVKTFIHLSLAIGITLGLLWGTSRGAYKDHQKSKAENLGRTLATIVIMLIKIFLSLLFILLLIEAVFFQGVGFEIIGYLALGWVPILFVQGSQLFQHWEAVSKAGAIMILALIAFHGFMHWRYSKTPQPLTQRKYSWKVSWTAGLAGVVIVVFLSGYAFIGATRHTAGVIQQPIVHKSSLAAYDSDTKSNLHYVYLACKAYWSDHGPDQSCNREIASRTTYGYFQSVAVRIESTGGENDFRALATNTNSMNWFWLDHKGAIKSITPSKEKS